MNTNEARRLFDTTGRTNLLVVHFTKRNGEHRRMLCYYAGARSRSPLQMVVFDVDKGESRTVNLDTVESIRPLKTRIKAQPEPVVIRLADRLPAPQTMEEARQRILSLIY